MLCSATPASTASYSARPTPLCRIPRARLMANRHRTENLGDKPSPSTQTLTSTKKEVRATRTTHQPASTQSSTFRKRLRCLCQALVKAQVEPQPPSKLSCAGLAQKRRGTAQSASHSRDSRRVPLKATCTGSPSTIPSMTTFSKANWESTMMSTIPKFCSSTAS